MRTLVLGIFGHIREFSTAVTSIRHAYLPPFGPLKDSCMLPFLGSNPYPLLQVFPKPPKLLQRLLNLLQGAGKILLHTLASRLALSGLPLVLWLLRFLLIHVLLQIRLASLHYLLASHVWDRMNRLIERS